MRAYERRQPDQGILHSPVLEQEVAGETCDHMMADFRPWLYVTPLIETVIAPLANLDTESGIGKC